MCACVYGACVYGCVCGHVGACACMGACEGASVLVRVWCMCVRVLVLSRVCMLERVWVFVCGYMCECGWVLCAWVRLCVCECSRVCGHLCV